VRQYHMPSSSAGEASVVSFSLFTCSKLELRTSLQHERVAVVVGENTLPLTPIGDAEKPCLTAWPSRS